MQLPIMHFMGDYKNKIIRSWINRISNHLLWFFKFNKILCSSFLNVAFFTIIRKESVSNFKLITNVNVRYICKRLLLLLFTKNVFEKVCVHFKGGINMVLALISFSTGLIHTLIQNKLDICTILVFPELFNVSKIS